MPKIVCNRCEVEYEPLKNGVNVIENASFGPYKIWQADTMQCPECGNVITAGFSREAIEHYEDGFKEILNSIKEPVIIKPV